MIGHTTQTVGKSFTLNISLTSGSGYPVITDPVPTNYPISTLDTTRETLILVSDDRLKRFYPGNDAGVNALVSQINTLAARPDVNGKVLDLDSEATNTNVLAIRNAFARWDLAPDNPQAANFVARNIKALIYSYAAAYPNLKYMVIVGDDRVIPSRRIVDEALIANERTYALSGATGPANQPGAAESLSAQRRLLRRPDPAAVPWP